MNIPNLKKGAALARVRHGTSEHAWADEFDGPAGSPPDPRWWGFEIGGNGWGNGELQRYTDRLANAVHDGQGNLVIRALQDGAGYSSARLVSKGRFAVRYGRVECRVLLPSGAGLWSAFWMLGSDIDRTPLPACGEIDVFENLGAVPRRVFGTVHCPHHFGNGGLSGEDFDPRDAPNAYKVVAVDRTPDSIMWSVDGREYFSVLALDLGSSWVFDHPFYLLINLAIGGELGGPVDRATSFPAELIVDYVRVFAAPQQVLIQRSTQDGPLSQTEP